MSVNVDSAITKSGMVENVGVAIDVLFVVAIHAQVSCICADFKVFPVFRPPYWYHLIVNSYSGKVAKAHPFVQSGLEMAAKIVVWGWFHPPPYHTWVNWFERC